MCAEQFYGEKCVIANSDILFEDNSIAEVIEEGSLVALTRWESPKSPRMLGHCHAERFFSGSQDAWGFIGGQIPALGKKIILGSVGCDQAIVGEAMQNDVIVRNPCLTVRTFHVHGDETRPKNRPCSFGLYGYPEITTDEKLGGILHHEWPTRDGRYEYEWGIREQ
jgi:hypothetical protein